MTPHDLQIRIPDNGCQRIIDLMDNPRDQLPQCRQIFRLNQLFLKPRMIFHTLFKILKESGVVQRNIYLPREDT